MDATTTVGGEPMGLIEYQEARPRLFPSESSLRWYLRHNRAELVAAGALLLHTGRWLVDAARFDAFVRERACDAARRQVEGKGGEAS